MDVESGEDRLAVVTAGSEGEAAKRLEAALETEVNGGGEGEGEEGGNGT